MLTIAPVATLKDIAIGITATSVLFAITLKSPLMGFLSTACIPLPTLFYRAKLGRRAGVWVPALALLFLVLLTGGFSIDFIYFFELVLIGFVLYELYEINLPVEFTILFACAAVLASSFVMLFVYSMLSNVGIADLINGAVRQNLQATIGLYKSMGMPEENIRLIESSFDRIQYYLVRLIPGLAIVSTLLVTWISLLLSRCLLTRQKLHVPDFGRLSLWKAPEPLVWPVIGCSLVLLIPERSLWLLGLNGLLILMTVYFFQGIAIVSFYFEKKKFPRVLRISLYVLIALQQIVVLIVIGLGFFDIWLNFRKLETGPPSET